MPVYGPSSSNESVWPVNVVAAAGATETLPTTNRHGLHAVTLTADCTLTFPTAGAGRSFVLAATQDSTGNWDIVWPAGIAWPDGIAATMSAGIAVTDVFEFTCYDGTTWCGETLSRRLTATGPPLIVQSTQAGATNAAVGDATIVYTTTPTEGNTLLVFSHAAGSRLATPPAGWTERYVPASTDGAHLQCFTHTVGSSEANSYAFDWDDTDEFNSLIAAEVSGVVGIDQVVTSTTGNQPPSFTNTNHPDLVFLHVGQNVGSGVSLSGGWETLVNKTPGYHQNVVGYQYTFGETAAAGAVEGAPTNVPRAVISLRST